MIGNTLPGSAQVLMLFVVTFIAVDAAYRDTPTRRLTWAISLVPIVCCTVIYLSVLVPAFMEVFS